MRIAIIGLGCAGYHAIKALRENGYAGELHVFSDTEHPPANPMLTTYYADGKIPFEAMFPFGDLHKLEEDYQVALHRGSHVLHVDARKRTVLSADGTAEPFDKILISTGARAVSPALGQKDGNRIFFMRTVRDAQQLKEKLDQGEIRSAIVAGASMVGIKVAELFASRNIPVILADLAEHLFPLSCMSEIAQILEAQLQEQGVAFLSGAGISGVTETAEDITVSFTDKTSVQTDALVICIGTRANVELVANTEVIEQEPVPVKKGIVVNERMETGCKDIYAAGDCCEALNIQTGKTAIIGLWANAGLQGEVAGANMAGKEAVYPGSLPNNITHYFDVEFIGIGDPESPGERFIFRDKNGILSAITENGEIKCVNILGNYRISGMIKELMVKRLSGDRSPLTPEETGLLKAGNLPGQFLDLLGGIK